MVLGGTITMILQMEQYMANFTIGLPGNSLTYLITHNMNKYPAVSVFEAGTSNQVYGNVTYNNLNQCTISFSSLVTGSGHNTSCTKSDLI